MSLHDQASGLRQWAEQQRMQHATDEAAAPAEVLTAYRPAPKVPARPLAIVGLTRYGHDESYVKGRLSQWAALGRRWAGDPDDWLIKLIDPERDALATLTSRYQHWALWVESDADAFRHMYRVLRQVSENGGPKRLLALHEPNLPRKGLLDNLRNAAANYLDIELLLLAR